MLKPQYNAHGECIAVVGGESGIGKALVTHLLSAGARVFSMDMHSSTSIPAHAHFDYLSVQPTDATQLNKAAEAVKKKSPSLTGLVCLSGIILHFKNILDLTSEQWEEEYDISFKSCFNACKAFAPLLLANKKGAIVNMSSGLAFGGQANYGPYTNAKASIVSLSRTLATELAPMIRVNSVAPGAVDTPFIYDDQGNTRFDKKQYENIAPLGTLATAEEIADLIMFLLSDASSHITGQCIHINGGAMMI